MSLAIFAALKRLRINRLITNPKRRDFIKSLCGNLFRQMKHKSYRCVRAKQNSAEKAKRKQ